MCGAKMKRIIIKKRKGFKVIVYCPVVENFGQLFFTVIGESCDKCKEKAKALANKTALSMGNYYKYQKRGDIK